MVFFWCLFGCVLGFKWVYLSSLPHFNYQSMIICLVLVFYWVWRGLFLGFVWRITKDVAGLLFLLRRLTRRGRNAACGQCPASGRARDGRFYRSRLASVTVYASSSPFLMSALQAAFAAYPRRQKDDGCGIPRSA